MTKEVKTRTTKPKAKKVEGQEVPPVDKGGEVETPNPFDGLDHKDNQIMRFRIEFPSGTWEQLAKAVGMSVGGVRKRCARPGFRKAMENATKETWAILDQAQNMAARKLAKLINAKDDRVALEACRLIMGPVLNKTQVDVKNVQEIIYRTRFGDQGQMISEKEEIPRTTPKNTLELLEGGPISNEG